MTSPATKPKLRARKPVAKAKKPATRTKTPAPRQTAADMWSLRLYVAGQTPRSLTAFTNLKRLCEEHLPGRHKIEVIDLMKSPELALGDQIVALPTLVRKLPTPIKRVIGDLSNFERVMIAIELQSAANRAAAK